ncbi:MAG: exo-beta-N-acetylmuramidase NamZ family protein [Gemmatimonadaceae bacterium]
MTNRLLSLATVTLLTAAASGCGPRLVQVRTAEPVTLGVETLLRDSLGVLREQRVGLITNHSGRDRAGRSTIDLLHRAPGVQLVALFGPEHGLRGVAGAGEHVASGVDSATGLPVYSLYGETRVPTPEMMRGVDVLVYDIQDVGARVYTYPWTMAESMIAAGRAGKRFVVLDRPNPIRGDIVQGGVLDTAFRSFVGMYPVPLRYGLTVGELARWLVTDGGVKVDLTVIPMRGWKRSMWWEQTGLTWVNPSPNLRTVEATILYPGTVMFEGTNLSEGRGTDAPFQLVGAPWLTDAGAIARALNARGLGVRFDSTSRTIEKGQKWGEQAIPMLRATVMERDQVKPLQVAAWMLYEIRSRHPADFQWKTATVDRLFGSRRLREAVEAGPAAIERLIPQLGAESEAWKASARRVWLYPE